jgi:hypothetical protein
MNVLFTDLCAAVLLNSDKSLLLFLTKTTSSDGTKFKELSRVRQEVLNVIGTVIHLCGRRIADYVLSIKEVILSVLRREWSNQVKAACFVPLNRILLLRLHTLDAETLGVREMIDLFLNEFTYKKASQSVRSAILRCIGLLAELYPEQMTEKCNQLFTLYIETLTKQFKTKKPDLTVLVGAVRGFTSFLVNFANQFVRDTKAMENVYKVVCLGCLNPPPGLRSYYNVPKAALTFLARHAPLFKQYLTEHSEKIYEYLVNYCTHKNRLLRSLAFLALDAFLTQVANEIVGEQRSAQSNLDTFKVSCASQTERSLTPPKIT